MARSADAAVLPNAARSTALRKRFWAGLRFEGNPEIGDRKKLTLEIAAWVKQRNNAKARIKWMFNTDKARMKLAYAYPDPVKES